jgi:adenylyltransferase/sulfurtransferase
MATNSPTDPEASSLTYEQQLECLQQRIRCLEEENVKLKHLTKGELSVSDAHNATDQIDSLTKDQIERYSRQLLLSDGFGVSGQLKLLSSSVLVVGAGGIGSTVLLYLAAAGVGKITIIDYDKVESSNLHRQVIHSEHRVGMNKAVSARRTLLALNPTIQCLALDIELTHENALDMVRQSDCIVDASDNPKTRYLINDACVIAGKPLISGSAVGTEGQLTVYNYHGGCCYRCLYPKAAASAGCASCSDAGVLGPVPGLIGVFQATETIKVLTGFGTAMHDRLLMYSSSMCSFHTIRKPKKSTKCPVCGPNATIKTMADSEVDLKESRGPVGPANESESCEHSILPPSVSISCSDYQAVRKDGISHVLLDVRVTQQFEMCSLEGAINIPLANIENELDRIAELSGGEKVVYCICRRGIASKEAAKLLLKHKEANLKIYSIRNVTGGLTAWHNQVDSSFPKY